MEFNLQNFLRKSINNPVQKQPGTLSKSGPGSNLPSTSGKESRINAGIAKGDNAPDRSTGKLDGLVDKVNSGTKERPSTHTEVESSTTAPKPDGKGGYLPEGEVKKEKGSFTDHIKQAAIDRLMSSMSGGGDGAPESNNPKQGANPSAGTPKAKSNPPQQATGGSPKPLQVRPTGSARTHPIPRANFKMPKWK